MKAFDVNIINTPSTKNWRLYLSRNL